VAVSGHPASKRDTPSLRPFPYQGGAPTVDSPAGSGSRAARARCARLAWIFGYASPFETRRLNVERVGWNVEVITSEDRFWDACPCAPLVVGYVTDLLGVEATRWEFAKAIVRSGHVSTLFLGPGGARDPLELWVSATHEGPTGWRLRHSELPARTRA
jgi:hypothetical protein